MKKCSCCKFYKDKSFFHKDKSRKNGLQNNCIQCVKTKMQTVYKDRYIEARRMNSREWYKANKDIFIKSINKYNKERDFGLHSKYWSLKRRCEYPSQYGYKWYGAKGVKVLWKSYLEFKSDMYESYIEHLNKFGKRQTTIDRIDSNGNYCKDNCRWATQKEQANNTSRNIKNRLLI